MAEESIIDLRSPSPHSSRRRRNTPYNPPTNPPSTPPVGFRSLLNPPRPAPRSSVVRAGGAHDGRRIAEVIRQRAETRDTREASADSVRARRPGIQAGPSRTGQGPWAESIQVVGSSDEDDEIVVTGASNLPAQRSPSPPVQALHSPVRRRAVEAGRFDRAMQVARFRPFFTSCSTIGNFNVLHTPVELEHILQRRREETEAILAQEDDERRRAILSPRPVPAPGPRRIGLGGAVYRAGDQQINYQPLYERYNRADNMMGRWWDGIDGWDVRGAGGWRSRAGEYLGNLGNMLGYGMGGEMAGIGLGGAGGAGRREDDVSAILSRIGLPDFDPPPEGFSTDFEIDESKIPITLDDDGRVVKRNRTKPYLACANCPAPLLISSAYRAPADRVWALRCGHMIDQRCLEALSTPTTKGELATVHHHPPGDLPILGEEAVLVKKGRTKRAKFSKQTSPPQPDEYEWRCPVEGCGTVHWSVQEGGRWAQKEGEGALSVYA